MPNPADALPISAWDVFESYSAVHALTVATGLMLMIGLALRGRAVRQDGGEPRLRYGLAGFTVAFWLFYNIWWNWDGIRGYDGLPLHICDVAGLLAPFALLSRNRCARATLYFWATALTSQAYIQPTLIVGPAHIEFWVFWISHTLILASALYDVAVLDFRPGWPDLGRVSAVSAIYFAIVLPVDIVMGSNYGYVGNPPPPHPIPPFVEFLGPWPDRLPLIVALAALAFTLALLPWRIAARRSRPSTGEYEQMGTGEAPGEFRP